MQKLKLSLAKISFVISLIFLFDNASIFNGSLN